MAYVVMSVLADGNAWTSLATYSPVLALRKLEAMRNRYKTYGPKQCHWVEDPDDPERGTIPEDELKDKSEGLCSDCGYFDPENTCRWRGLP